VSSLPPPAPPPPPPPPIAPPPPISSKRSGVPAWVWIVAVVAVFGGGAVALFTLGGDDDKPASSPITTVETSGSEPNGTDVADSVPATTGATTGTTTGGGVAPTGATGTREAPVPAGEIADIGAGWRLQILDVIPDASEMMAAEDEFFQPPPAGFTFMLVNIALGYFGTEDPQVGFSPDVEVLGESSVALDNFCLSSVPDEINFFNYVFSGGVLTGNACFLAPVGEAGTFQMFGKGDFFLDEGVYLDVAKPASPAQPMQGLSGPQPGAAATPARLTPTPLGTTTAVGTDWQLTVTGAARDITAEVLAENQFNDPPPTGFRYVGVEMTYTYSGAGGASPSSVSIGSVGDANVQNEGYCGVVANEIDMFTDLFAGGSVSGTVCLVVPEDAGAIALYATSDFNGFIWFATR